MRMIKMKELVTILFALFVLIVPALSQDIHNAVKKGDLEKVKRLLEKNPELVNAKDSNGSPPLLYALIYRHEEVAELLIRNRANLNFRAFSGET